MADVKITIIPHGPAKVEFDNAEIVMPDGRVISKTKRVSLCRCGETKDTPFCDGTHAVCGFDK